MCPEVGLGRPPFRRVLVVPARRPFSESPMLSIDDN